MPRLIDANALITDIQGTVSEVCMKAPYDAEWFTRMADRQFEIIETIKRQPEVDAVEVKRGRWEERDWVKYDGHGECIHYPKAAWCCSNCRNAFKKELLWKKNYCPNCGAKMDGDGNG